MKDYTWYVWGSYGVAFLCIALELFFLKKRSRETKA
jgi:heme exporter protein CcmD